MNVRCEIILKTTENILRILGIELNKMLPEQVICLLIVKKELMFKLPNIV